MKMNSSFFFLYGLEYDVFWSKTDGPDAKADIIGLEMKHFISPVSLILDVFDILALAFHITYSIPSSFYVFPSENI